MEHLYRELAPITASAWTEIEKDAKRTLKTICAARKLVDFVGPLGWRASAVSKGRVAPVVAPAAGNTQANLRQLLPVVELREPFEMDRRELDALDRGAQDFDTNPVIAAARAIAIAEDRAVFHGYPPVGIEGICAGSTQPSVQLSDDYTAYPELVTAALNHLRDAGVDGPYALALSERCYTGLMEARVGGYPVLEHVRPLIDGPLVWAPGLDGAVVMSMRGDDFQLTVGQDFSIGYLDHDARIVQLYIEESFTFWLLSPQAAVPLEFPSA